LGIFTFIANLFVENFIITKEIEINMYHFRLVFGKWIFSVPVPGVPKIPKFFRDGSGIGSTGKYLLGIFRSTAEVPNRAEH